jgi:DNA-binding NtrC family response regulator
LFEQLSSHPKLHELELRRCASAAEAMVYLCAQAWDVVVTDPSLSPNTSLTIARTLSWLRPAVRLIALSPTATNEDIIRAIRAHVFAFFSAPFDSWEIVDVLRTALGASDWQQGSTWCPICHPMRAANRTTFEGSARLVHVRLVTSMR